MGKGKRFNKKKKSNIIEKNNIDKKRQNIEQKNNKKRIRNNIFILLFSILLIFSCTQIVMWYVNTKKDEEQYQKLIDEIVTSNTNNNLNNIEGEGIKTEEVSINFEQLLNINNDVVGWIIIEGTNINYPILKSSDNEYYLKRDINKNISKSGSIYLDYRNSGFSDKNPIVYGHNMKSGTMFSELKKIYNNELGTEVKINIYTPDEYKVYRVFSTYTIKPEDFRRNMKVSEIQNKSKIDFNVDVDENDKILTLFTCTDSMLERIIVHAVVV